MEHVGIVAGLRTYIGVEGGMYRNVSAEQLGAHVLRQIPVRCGIPVEDIDMVIAGNGIGGGDKTGFIGSRLSAGDIRYHSGCTVWFRVGGNCHGSGQDRGRSG